MLKGLKSIYDRKLHDNEERDLREIMAAVAAVNAMIEERLDPSPARQLAQQRLLESAAWVDLALRSRLSQRQKDAPQA